MRRIGMRPSDTPPNLYGLGSRSAAAVALSSDSAGSGRPQRDLNPKNGDSTGK